MPADDPHHLGHRQRLRERFLKAGLEGLADYEVVELVLTLAIPRADVKAPAKRLLARFGSLRAVLDASSEELQQIPGIGPVTPAALRLIREVAHLYLRQGQEEREIADPAALAEYWQARIGGLPHEVFQVAYLDSGRRLVRGGIETLEEGTVDWAAVYPRRLIESALKRGAAALVLAHNHPSGDVQPSDQDRALTRALALAASSVQIEVLEHLIVTRTRVFSFRKAGLL
ncbi:MAG: DNA repair protein RadC [Armatimonadetes bacterium]|nr:DNA repair protein RadC [Armatimonadota bacterium]